MEEIYMKATGLRVCAAIIFLIGIVAGVIAFISADAAFTGVIALLLFVAIGFAIALILCIIANSKENKEKRANINAAMNAVEDVTVLDSDEIAIAEDVPAIDDIFADDEFLLDPIEEEAEVDAPKTKYQIVREKIIAHTPITEEHLDKAEKIGKVAIPVAAAASVVLMAAKLAGYQKNERRRRAFFDWIG